MDLDELLYDAFCKFMQDNDGEHLNKKDVFFAGAKFMINYLAEKGKL